MTPAPCPAARAPVRIRPSADADLPAMTAIYADAVRTGTGSFELEAPGLQDMTARRAAVLAQGLPWLVLTEGDERVRGYAYAAPFRARPAYRFTLEDSIYLEPAARGHGLGRLLLAELLAQCEARGARQMLAVIGDSANLGSVALHRRLGFAPAGTLAQVGWKFGRWLDVVLMQRALGPGAGAPPDDQNSTRATP